MKKIKKIILLTLVLALTFSTCVMAEEISSPQEETTSSAEAEYIILETNENGEIETEDDGILRIFVDRNERIIQAPKDENGNYIAILKDNNGNYFDRNGNPVEIIVVDVITAETETTTQSLAEQTRWNPARTSYKTSINANITEVTRFEMFYGVDEEVPSVTFISPRGDVVLPTIRGGIDMEGYDKLDCKVIYLDPMEEPGTWQIDIEISQASNNFLFITSETPKNWDMIVSEYKTSAVGLLKWYFSNNSLYDSSDIAGIVAPSSVIPAINNIEEYEEEEIEKEPNWVLISILAVLLLAVVITITVILVKKQKKAKFKEEMRKNVDSANNALEERKRYENENLDQFISQYQDDYNDDEQSSEELAIPDEDMKKYISEPSTSFADEESLKRISNFAEKKERARLMKESVDMINQEENPVSDQKPGWIQQTIDNGDDEDDNFF